MKITIRENSAPPIITSLGASVSITENNSSYVEVARGGSYFDNYDAQRVNNATCQAIIDCTDTSNVKVKFRTTSFK